MSTFANAVKQHNEGRRKSTFFSMQKKEDPAIKLLKQHLEPSDNRSAQMDASVESSDFQSNLDYQ